MLLSMCGLACSSAAESDKTPNEQCADYVHAYCAKAVSCAASTDRADLAETCAFAFRVYLPCEKVEIVEGDSQSCIDAVDAIPCATVNPGSFLVAPVACQRLFGVSQ